jgi:hypothetical protein
MSTNQALIDTLIAVLTLLGSAVVSTFVAGRKYGALEAKVQYLDSKLAEIPDKATMDVLISKLDFMSDRLAKIEGMFTLRLKDGLNE